MKTEIKDFSIAENGVVAICLILTNDSNISTYYGTTIAPDNDALACLATVNSTLTSLGYPTVDDTDMLSQIAEAWTSDVVTAFKTRLASSSAV